MDGRQLIALGSYVVLIGTVFSGLFEPFTQGDDDSWAIVVVILCAHFGLALTVARAWILVLPVLLSVVLAIAAGEAAALVLILGLPPLLIVTALGWVLGRVLGRRALLGAALAFGVALWPVAWAASEQLDRARADHVPKAVQARLPTQISLGNLCPGTATPPAVRRDVRQRAESLVRELEGHPDDLVRRTLYLEEDPDPLREDITVRQLAQEQLEDLETNGGSKCEPALQRRLREGIG
jgi:hypothetical protein